MRPAQGIKKHVLRFLVWQEASPPHSTPEGSNVFAFLINRAAFSLFHRKSRQKTLRGRAVRRRRRRPWWRRLHAGAMPVRHGDEKLTTPLCVGAGATPGSSSRPYNLGRPQGGPCPATSSARGRPWGFGVAPRQAIAPGGGQTPSKVWRRPCRTVSSGRGTATALEMARFRTRPWQHDLDLTVSRKVLWTRAAPAAEPTIPRS